MMLKESGPDAGLARPGSWLRFGPAADKQGRKLMEEQEFETCGERLDLYLNPSHTAGLDIRTDMHIRLFLSVGHSHHASCSR
jgi:hypothetical protein